MTCVAARKNPAHGARMTLPACHCGAPAFAVRPGSEPVFCAIGGVAVPVHAEPDKAWCRACWIKTFGKEERLVTNIGRKLLQCCERPQLQ